MPSVLRIKNPDGTWYEVTALKGDTGITPNLQVGTVTTGNPGTSAEVTITGTPEEPVLNFKIPKGDSGTGGDGGANINDTTPSTSTTYSSTKIEEKLTALNDANAALIEVSKTKPNAENTELWIYPDANEVQLPQIDDSVESVQDTWSSKKIAAEVSNKANEKDLAAVAKSGSYTDLTNKPTIPTVPTTLPNPNALTFTGAVNETYDGSAAKSVAIPTVPTALKNPNKLTFKGAVTAEYDGSATVEVTIPEGGSGGYTLPTASPTTLGGVKPVSKTNEMTQAVGVDEAGGLWTMAGGKSKEELRIEMELTEEASVLEVDLTDAQREFLRTITEIYARAYIVRPSEGSTDSTGMQNVQFGLKHPNYFSFLMFRGDVVPTPSVSYCSYCNVKLISSSVLNDNGISEFYAISDGSPQNINAIKYNTYFNGGDYTRFQTLRLECKIPMGVGTKAVLIARR